MNLPQKILLIISSGIYLTAEKSLTLWMHSEFWNLLLLAESSRFDGTSKHPSKNYKANSCLYLNPFSIVS
jgi:hypothetical protein